MNELTIIEINGEDRFDSRLLASGLGIQHKNLVETLNKYSAEIQMFGKVPFQTEALPSGQSTQYYLLNRNQCDFVGSLSKNTPKVVAFKAMLVASFANARRSIITKPQRAKPGRSSRYNSRMTPFPAPWRSL